VRRERDHDVEFMTLMWFDTLGSVKEFMGEDYETRTCRRRRGRCSPASTGDRPITRCSIAAEQPG
jgi:hypothetical protein